jgi:hypothetical protein
VSCVRESKREARETRATHVWRGRSLGSCAGHPPRTRPALVAWARTAGPRPWPSPPPCEYMKAAPTAISQWATITATHIGAGRTSGATRFRSRPASPHAPARPHLRDGGTQTVRAQVVVFKSWENEWVLRTDEVGLDEAGTIRRGRVIQEHNQHNVVADVSLPLDLCHTRASVVSFYCSGA